MAFFIVTVCLEVAVYLCNHPIPKQKRIELFFYLGSFANMMALDVWTIASSMRLSNLKPKGISFYDDNYGLFFMKFLAETKL
jgi:hypothetical protein